MNQVRLTRIFWMGAAATLVVAALSAIVSILGGSFGETEGQILVTLLALVVAGGTVVAGLTLAERGVLPRAGHAAAGVATLGFLVVTASTWEGWDDDTLSSWALTAAVIVPTILVASTQLLLLRDRGLVPLVVGSDVALGLAALLTTAGIWADDIGEGTWKLVVALWIIGLLGWLLVPVVQRISRVPPVPVANAPERVIADLHGVELVANGTRSSDGLSIETVRGELVVSSPTGAIHLRPGERIVLRKRPA